MKLINPFKRKQVNQNKIIEIKYSKLDNIGKVKKFEIPDKNEIDNSLGEMDNKITQLTNKINGIPDWFFERIKIKNLNGPTTIRKEIKINPSHVTREYLTIGNKEYMNFYFRAYPDPIYQVELNDLSYNCNNLVKIYLVKISGGGGEDGIATYDWYLHNYIVYTNTITNPRGPLTINFMLPDLEGQLFWLVTHPQIKDPNLFNNAVLTIRIDYFSNVGGQYYRNIEGEGDN